MDIDTLLTAHGIDAEAVHRIQKRFNTQKERPREFQSFPSIDGDQVISAADIEGITLSRDECREFLDSYLPGFTENDFPELIQDDLCYAPRSLLEIWGMLLYPYTAFGILNGGSATSYIDTKKNQSYGEQLFASVQPVFSPLSDLCSGKPKGSTPGFINPDGTPGRSFMYLKVRSLMIESLKYRRLMEKRFPDITPIDFGIIPLFQMTSNATHEPILHELAQMRQDTEYLKLSRELGGAHLSDKYTAVQPMIAAFRTYLPGDDLKVFLEAGGASQAPLPLPGGHGQNFSVLEPVYQTLHREGKRFAFLGNIDNLGNTVNPLHLALTALKKAQGSFEFSFKTPVDVKGGVLVRNSEGKLDCMDIGPGIDEQQVEDHVKTGNELLFNCAAGLFSLDTLVRDLEQIIETLPLRISNQHKDAGAYSQIEQITWEVIGLLEKPLIIGVRKHERFLAAKLLIEQILTSLAPDYIDGETKDTVGRSFLQLHTGLKHLLRKSYGLALQDGSCWEELPIDQLD